MCFSASASISAGVVLLVVGAEALRRTRRRVELPFALIPVLFAVHQLIEGALWLTFPRDAPGLNAALTQAYSLFSQVLWPVYVPMSVLVLERSRWRRRILGATALAGGAVSMFLLYMLLHEPVVSRLTGGHIEYIFPHAYPWTSTGLYVLGACASLLFSSYRSIRLFGIATVISLVAAYALYSTWFISVWCFFGALLSTLVLGHFAGQKSRRLTEPV